MRITNRRITSNKTDIVVGVIILIICGFALMHWQRGIYIMANAERPLQYIALSLKCFITENGRFPSSQEDMVKSDFLQIPKSRNKAYKIRINHYRPMDAHYVPNWKKCRNFRMFDIKYGIDINSIEIADGILRKVEDKTTVFLIEGPNYRQLSKTYHSSSVDLYKEIIRQQLKRKRLEKAL